MKLNLDGMRDVLLYIEDEQTYNENLILEPINTVELYEKFPQYECGEIIHACEMLNDANFIVFSTDYADNALYFAEVNFITKEGYDFIATIRPTPVWENVKKAAKSFFGGSIKVLSQVASATFAQYLYDLTKLN